MERDSTGNWGTRYITNVFKPAPSSASYRILETKGISGGIFFSENLIKMNIKEDTNLIDAYGMQQYFPAYQNSLDALVVFPNIHPKSPAKKLN